MNVLRVCGAIVGIVVVASLARNAVAESAAKSESVANPVTVQELLDSHPGQTVTLEDRDYMVDAAIRIHTNGSGLCGAGRIIQSNANAPIILVENVNDVRIADVTLTRAPSREETAEPAIRATKCEGLDIAGVRIQDNRSLAGTISLELCKTSRIRNCAIINYQRIGVDDRTENELYGYAFKVIDGTGISVRQSTDLQIEGNLIDERRIFPTNEVKDANRLGELTDGRKPTKKGRLAPKDNYANNWHQGSAILVTAPEETDHVLIAGNVIKNAAQGIDIHADHVTCSNNSIDYAFIGIKCMHGARNVIISGNNVSHMDLWGLVMLPGTASHPAEAAADGKPARVANFTRGNIIANNVFSDYGFGYEYFNWQGSKGGVISLESGQLPENPIMTDVIVQGNVVYDTGRDQVIVDGKPTTVEPRYNYAVFITPNPSPQGLVFTNNIFHPGRSGISNIPLK